MIDEKTIRSNTTEYSNKLEKVTEAYNDLLSFLDGRNVLVADIRKKTDAYLNDYLNKSGINEIKSTDLKKVKAPLNQNNNDSSLIESIYKLMIYSSYAKEAMAFLNNNDRLGNVLAEAKFALKGGLLWALAGREKKARSVRAMNEVERVYELGYTDRAYDIIRRFAGFDYHDAKQEFLNHTKEFIDYANNHIGPVFYIDDDPKKPDFRKLKKEREDYINLISSLDTVERKINSQAEAVKICASNMANKEAIRILNDVSIDEVNRDKKGIRTSALKNAGINTIGDALVRSEYKIGSIYGISELNAHVIKKFANEKLIETRNNVKLKLNTDEKSEEATRLIDELQKYIGLKTKCKEIIDIDKEYGKAIRTAISSINESDDDIKWLYSNITKKEYYSNIDRLYELLDDKNIVQRFNEIRHSKDQVYILGMNSSDLWKYYENNSAACMSALDELMPGYFGNSDTFYGLPEELAEEIQEECIFPDGLLVTLRRYQEWGVKYILHQKKVLLGDEMGLGKTIQAIAAMVSLRNVGEKHFLVICPASVLINWCREIEKHSKLKPIKLHGSGRKTAFDQWLKNGGVGVTTYETAGSFVFPDDFRYSMLTVDEAHYVKNAKALRTANIIKLGNRTDRILYMTGTALENRVEEMIELISHLKPRLAETIKPYAYMSSSEIFRQKVAPVYYRRKREDVLTELPDLIENKEWCSLEGEEKRVYEEAILGKHRDEARRVSWNVEDLNNSSKAQRLKEIVELVKEDDRKLIVFSFYLDTIRKLYEYFHEICLYPITGSVNVNRRQEIIDEFEKSPAGTMLIAQITAGGTGLNIQSASVVVIAEPQYKPSVENQAISRAYRMGQTRNVLVYRLLCENTIDERMTSLLEEKQQLFDAFADKSVAAQANLELDNKTIGNIIEEEIERIKKERGEYADREQTGEETEEGPINPNRRNMDPTSVTGRINVVSQPYGGYLSVSSMSAEKLNDGKSLYPQENRSPSTVGLAVDYLTRFMLSDDLLNSFSISYQGARKKDKFNNSNEKEASRFIDLLYGITGLDDRSIINACLLTEYDVWLRNAAAAMMIEESEPVIPDQNTINNIRIMVQRSIDFFNTYGPMIKNGFTFEPNGYSNVVIKGDGDFLTDDTIWDYKVSKNEPTKDHTLQLLMYYIMGKHSGNPIFENISKIGIFNPRLNKLYLYDMNNYPNNLLREIEQDIICYEE